MTYTLSVAAGESDARTIAERLDERDIGVLAIDASEISPLQWQVVVYFDGPPGKPLLGLRLRRAEVLRRSPPLSVAKLPEAIGSPRALKDWHRCALAGSSSMADTIACRPRKRDRGSR